MFTLLFSVGARPTIAGPGMSALECRRWSDQPRYVAMHCLGKDLPKVTSTRQPLMATTTGLYTSQRLSRRSSRGSRGDLWVLEGPRYLGRCPPGSSPIRHGGGTRGWSWTRDCNKTTDGPVHRPPSINHYPMGCRIIQAQELILVLFLHPDIL